MNRSVASLALASIVTLAACTGDDTAGRVSGPDPVTVPPTTEAPPASDPDPTTSDSGPEVGDTTTTASTTTTTTTEPAPTTTIDPIAEIEAAVKQARLDREAAYERSAAEPMSLELKNLYAEFFTAREFVDRGAFIDRLASDGTVLARSTEVPKSVTFPGPFELVDEMTAIMQVCRVDSDIILIPSSSETPEIIVDDRIVATLTAARFVLQDGRWLADGGTRINRWEDGRECVS